jgi:hypothetical protein
VQFNTLSCVHFFQHYQQDTHHRLVMKIDVAVLT